MSSNNSDIAVAIGQQIDFFAQNKSQVGQALVSDAEELTGLAYDSITQTLYMSDVKDNKGSMLSTNLSNKDSEPFSMLNYENGTSISSIVFDPETRTLFWTDGLRETLMKMHVPSNGESIRPSMLHNLMMHNPHGIALDICNRYIYWTNSNSTVHSIERSRLDGSERSVIIDNNLYAVYGLAVDHTSAKLYWSDDIDTVKYKIERSNLDGTERETLQRGRYHLPVYLAVDNEAVYWADWTAKAVWRVKKNKGAKDEPDKFASYEKSHPSAFIKSIITRDNVGKPNCEAMLRVEKERQNHKATPASPMKSSINLTTSTKEMNSTTKAIQPCLNEGHYDEQKATCHCRNGFSGTRCETSVCHNYCVNGHCAVDSKGLPECTCTTAYNGERCERDVCDGYCLNNGVCSVSATGPSCKCENSSGSRCQYTNELDKFCSLYCMGTKEMLNSLSLTFCRCSELNETLSEGLITSEPLLQSTLILSVLLGVITVLSLVVAVLSYHVHKLRRRPRIRKRFVVSKGGVTPLTSRPQGSTDSCEITIENCCNMNICETPCFEPKLRATPTKSSSTKKEEKNSLLESMEGADSC
ncbi:protein cueball isoform X2 [Athalia rosae]|uniref:protein cueball isoform X2 n=1 Tax=Athalia rosae TaxID=37344 RepID=UPI00203429D9|nr:protein cueball isoform X2 [Athalia rosae]